MRVANAQGRPKLTTAVIFPRRRIGGQAAHIQPAQRAPRPAQRLGDRAPHADYQRTLRRGNAIALKAVEAAFGQHIGPDRAVRQPKGRQFLHLAHIHHGLARFHWRQLHKDRFAVRRFDLLIIKERQAFLQPGRQLRIGGHVDHHSIARRTVATATGRQEEGQQEEHETPAQPP